MDSSSSSSSVHASMPISSFSSLPPQDQLAVIQRISPCDKPTLSSIASTNRQINVLATPLLVDAYIGHVENKIKTMKTSAEKVTAILLVHRKLMENTSGLPVMGSEALWERLKVLILNEASCLASIQELHKGIQLGFLSPQLEERSVEQFIAFQRSCALIHEISQILSKGYKNLAAQIMEAVRYS
ncbi:hypothetical protein ABC383_14020 [Noviherbaspirillum sp. 1P10PC]|uniref:hypothetical protein n=1 Tax=Noviherbaspirillum sp. 1P10PC TaxID=3132292 RepID=UPI0039A08A5A